MPHESPAPRTCPPHWFPRLARASVPRTPLLLLAPAAPVPLLISPPARQTLCPPGSPLPLQRPREAEAVVVRSPQSCLRAPACAPPPRPSGGNRRCREPLDVSQRPAREVPGSPGSRASQPASRLLLGSGPLGLFACPHPRASPAPSRLLQQPFASCGVFLFFPS